MKKYLLSLTVLLSATLFSACNNDSNGPSTFLVPVSNGAYVVCSGNSYSSMP